MGESDVAAGLRSSARPRAKQRAYAQRLEEAIGANHSKWKEQAVGQVFGGSSVFVAEMRKRVRSRDHKKQKGAGNSSTGIGDGGR